MIYFEVLNSFTFGGNSYYLGAFHEITQLESWVIDIAVNNGFIRILEVEENV